MKTNHIHILFSFLFALIISISYKSVAGNFTWNGVNNTSWSTPDNWTPNAIPSTNDTITITTATNNLQLSSNKTVYRLVMQNDSMNLGSYTLTVSSSSSFTGGYISNGTLDLRGTSVVFSGTRLGATVSVAASSVKFNGSIFDQAVTADITGSTSDTSNGSNTFHSSFSITNSGLKNIVLGKTGRDTYNGTVTVFDTGTAVITLAYYDTLLFNGDIIVSSKGSGITFGNTSGYAKVASGKTITLGSKGFSSGTLLLNHFLQTSTTAQSFTLTSSAILSIIASNFGGAVTLTSPSILAKSSTFNGKSIFTWTGTSSCSWEGGNTFNGVTRYTNSGSGHITMQTSAGDNYSDSVTINGGTARFYSTTAEQTLYYGNLYFTGSSVSFANGTGQATFAGGANQEIKGSSALLFKNVKVNKSSGTVTLQCPVTIMGVLSLANGKVISDTTNLLTIAHGATCSNASNASFVSGPVKKTGNSIFTFPIGAGNSMSVVGISAPANTSDSFMAQFFEGANPLGNTLDTLLNSISDCGYWKITRTNGTSNVKITLGWDTFPCLNYCDTNVKIGVWKNSKWQNVNVDTVTTNTPNKGHFTSSSTVSDYSFFLVANVKSILINVFGSTAPKAINDYFGYNLWDIASEDDMALSNINMPQSIINQSPATLRFPAAIPSNWWDWRSGRFIMDRRLDNNMYYLPEKYQNIGLNSSNGLPGLTTDFFTHVYNTGCTPFYCLNALTSDKLYQAAFLYHLKGNNIPVQLMEFGNELYSNEDYNATRFNSGTEYAELAIDWGIKIKESFILTPSVNTTNFQIGLCASRFNRHTNSRNSQWNSKMFARINLQSDFFPDAIILHDYIDAGFTEDPPVPCEEKDSWTTSTGLEHRIVSPFDLDLDISNGGVNCSNDMELIFSNTFRKFAGESGITSYKGFKNEELDPTSSNTEAISDDYEIWITEYNSNVNNVIFHGSWAHGLSVALQTMLYLESDRITKVNCFKIIGDAITSAVFGNNDGFDYENATDGKKPSPNLFTDPSPVTTTAYAPTAAGHTLGLIAEAIRNADFAVQLGFSAPKLPLFDYYKRYGSTNFEPKIYGWQFKDSLYYENQAIILNLSSEEVLLSGTFFADFNTYEQIYCDPAAFVTGFGQVNETDGPIFTHTDPQTYSQIIPLIRLKPYSILRLFKYECSVTVKALSDKVCAGTTSSVMAFGNETWTYNWDVDNTTDITLLTPDTETPTGSTLSFSVSDNPTAALAEFTVTVTDAEGCSIFTGTVTVDIAEKRAISVVDHVTTDRIDDLVVCNGDNLQWDATVSYHLSSPASYHCILINSNGEGVAESDESNTLLSFDVDTTADYFIYAYDGTCAIEWGSVEIKVPWLELGENAYICEGSDYTITPMQVPDPATDQTPDDPGEVGYYWSNGNTTENPTFSNITTITTISVTMTYINSDGDPCEINDYITLYPVACCTGTDATFNGGTLDDFIITDGIDSYVQTDNTNGTIDIDASILGVADPLEIVINGKLLIKNHNLRLINCHITMGEAAEIVVDRHMVLILQGTIMEACTTKMWKGIRLLESATIRTERFVEYFPAPDPDLYRYNEINDAQYAISASERCQVFLDNFDDNGDRLDIPAKLTTLFQSNVTTLFRSKLTPLL